MVRKRDDTRDPFRREKVTAGILKATKNRPVSEFQVEELVDRVEERLRRKGPEVTSQQVGIEVLQQLRKLDEVAYIRFASVYKDFQEITDFERELGTLLKREPAKRKKRAPSGAETGRPRRSPRIVFPPAVHWRSTGVLGYRRDLDRVRAETTRCSGPGWE